MKIANYFYQNRTWIGRVNGNDIQPLFPDKSLDDLLGKEGGLGQLGQAAAGGPSLDLKSVKLLPPVLRPPKILCIGLNYRDHCRENNVPIPPNPVIFSKFTTALTGAGDPIVMPSITQKLDYEAELAVVIGRGGKHIPESQALSHVAGYTAMNDVSARDIQFGDGQWIRGKTLDTFAPLGPWLVTPDELGDPNRLAIRCRLNGQTVQDSSTGEMIFPVPVLIAFISQAITLLPGDVISTGTPHGVGVFRKPPLFMRPGDAVEVEIEKIGTLRNPVTAEARS